MAVAFAPVLAASTWALVASLGGGAPVLLVVLAVAGILATVALAAACAAHAVLRRRWGWAAALLVGWPIAVPLYLWRRTTAT